MDLQAAWIISQGGPFGQGGNLLNAFGQFREAGIFPAEWSNNLWRRLGFWAWEGLSFASSPHRPPRFARRGRRVVYRVWSGPRRKGGERSKRRRQ